MSERIVIVGAGEAGTRAALSLREQKWKGEIVLVGEEPETPYERPPLSKAVIKEQTHPPLLCNQEKLQEQQIDFRPGTTVRRIDRGSHELALSNEVKVRYDRLLLATGAIARPLNIPGGQHALLLRSLDDAKRLRKRFAPESRLILVGAGFIGLELAAAAVGLGCRVTVLEQTPRIMCRGVPGTVAQNVEELHRQAGVELHCGITIAEIRKENGEFKALARGGQEWTADTVVAGIGAAPQTRLAETSGLELENGIRVNGELRTSDPDIYAAGDCCSFPHPLFEHRRIRLEMWRSAREQAECAARNLTGSHQMFQAVPWFWSDQYDQTLQMAGLPDYGSQQVLRQRADGVKLHFELTDENRLVCVAAVGQGNSVAKDVRLGERLIENRVTIGAESLADPNLPLKKLLKV